MHQTSLHSLLLALLAFLLMTNFVRADCDEGCEAVYQYVCLASSRGSSVSLP